jgi:hypothetical protein
VTQTESIYCNHLISILVNESQWATGGCCAATKWAHLCGYHEGFAHGAEAVLLTLDNEGVTP